jgi:hypothetical protein
LFLAAFVITFLVDKSNRVVLGLMLLKGKVDWVE